MKHSYPAVFMRGGTSKGVFFKAQDLPDSAEERDAIFLRALGSPDPYERQLDGMGGGVSSLSKVAVISASQRHDADVDYTFGQVAVNKPVVDYSANCGNLSSAVGPFAVDQGIIEAADGDHLVRIFNTNTNKIIRSYFRVKNRRFDPKGDFEIAGVPGSGSPIRLEFTDPAGASTGKLLPTGNPIDRIELAEGQSYQVSLVDASNPVVFVAAKALGLKGTEHPDQMERDPSLMTTLDQIRRKGGVLMGFADQPQDVPLANPKIALAAAPLDFSRLDGQVVDQGQFQISIRIISMERVHRAVTSTGALCTAAAVNIPGSIPYELASGHGDMAIGNPSGTIPVGAKIISERDEIRVESLILYRTARRLMAGQVYVE